MAKANGHYEQFQLPHGEAVPLISQRIEAEPSRPAGRTPSPAFVETDGEVLRDGRILDLICTPGPPEKLAWLVWDNGEYLAADQVEFEGRIYVPPQQPRGLAPAM